MKITKLVGLAIGALFIDKILKETYREPANKLSKTSEDTDDIYDVNIKNPDKKEI